ncbi:MAG: glutamate 5-kinase [Bacteroidota bacterium]
MKPLPILVIKIGTSAISQASGKLDEPRLIEVSRQLARLADTYRLLLVSSGAVGCGKSALDDFSGKLIERKAAAAIGNPLLLTTYATFFRAYGLQPAQILCERRHFSDRKQFLQLRDTLEYLWQNDIIPIANENDVVSNLELKFSDNDELASLLAVGLGASHLLMVSSVPGLLDESNKTVPVVKQVDAEIMGTARTEKSAGGLGGMISKLTFARLATRLGISVTILGLEEPDSIIKATQQQSGTFFPAQVSSSNARQRWLASGSLVSGRIVIDQGAEEALKNRKSLLAVGVVAVQGPFEANEVVEIHGPDQAGGPVALARIRLDALAMEQKLGQQEVMVAHADEVVLLG